MRTYKYYTHFKITASLLTTLLSAVFYYLNTKDAALKAKISGIAVNLFVNYIMAENSIDFETGLIDNHKKYQAIAYPLGAAILSAPQTAIAYLEGESDSKTLAYFAASATLLSNSTLYMNSLKGLVDFMQCDIIPRFKSATPEAWTIRQNAVHNLEILLERVRFSNYKEKELSELQAIPIDDEKNANALIRLALLLEQSTKKANYPQKTVPKKIAKLLPQLAVASMMVFGSFGYDCGVEAALTTYFLSASPQSAAALALLLMSCLFILNTKAAFMLVSGIINTVSSIIKYGRLPNDCHLGGPFLKILTTCSPFLALMLTSFSGFTASNLYDKHCATSQLHFLQFYGANTLIDYSTRTFNGTYAELSIIESEKNYIKGSVHYEKDRAYLTIMDSLGTLLRDIKLTPADELQAMLESLGPDCARLADPFLFENLTARNMEEARLLP